MPHREHADGNVFSNFATFDLEQKWGVEYQQIGTYDTSGRGSFNSPSSFTCHSWLLCSHIGRARTIYILPEEHLSQCENISQTTISGSTLRFALLDQLHDNV